MPEEKNFFQSLNTITRVIEDPCSDKWTLLVETAKPAAKEALLVLFTPSWSEILENYLNPVKKKGGGRRGGKDDRKRRRSRKGVMRRVFTTVFPDVDDLIANHLPGVDIVRGRKAGSLQRWIFTGIDWADRVALFWMIIELVDEFAYSWSSGIMESRFCEGQFDVVAGIDFPGDAGHNFNFFHENLVHGWDVQKNVEFVEDDINFIDPNEDAITAKGIAVINKRIRLDDSGDPGNDLVIRPEVIAWHPDGSATTFKGEAVNFVETPDAELSVTGFFDNAIAVTFRTDVGDISGTEWTDFGGYASVMAESFVQL